MSDIAFKPEYVFSDTTLKKKKRNLNYPYKKMLYHLLVHSKYEEFQKNILMVQ